MFDTEYSNQAVKFLKNTDKVLAKRILEKVEELQENPFPSDMKKTKGESLFRVRVGKIRILYEIDHAKKKMGIVKIDKRDKVYD